ncbi:hypothetical protein CAZ10_24540 [Pseudomonas aeruginosa]|uniref:ATPase AAA-type core domain-containing protein n=3 Tax=Pseudomonas TaxID=286 RepID=A0A241XLT9_PSEAI|nr:AAA family ATPase [Pseudomonas aeruginosa]OTI58287.1 hypothetical protein CAZ10_24540 [Pseudomonas aeruginosa]
MAIIEKISIDGFKSIWNESIELGQLNIFLGTNGAGKSNLLEAIAMVSSSLEGGIDYERLARRGSRLSSPEIFRSAFKGKDRRHTFKIEVCVGGVNYNMSVRSVNSFSYFSESVRYKNRTIAGRSHNGSTLLGVPFDSKLDQKRSIFPFLQSLRPKELAENKKTPADLLSTVEKFAIYSPSTPILRGIATDSSSKSPLGIYGGRLAEALNEVINEKNSTTDLRRFFRLLDWFKKIGTTQETEQELISEHVNLGRLKLRYEDKYMKSTFNKLYAYDVSEGALFVLFVLVLLIHKDSPPIFALDNIDNALNPGLVRSLMGHIVQILKDHEEKQIFLTTHNPSTLDGLDIFNEKHRLFIVERNEEGHTKCRRIAPPEGMTKKDWEEKYFGMKLSEIWLSGAIGGMPIGF